MSRPRQSEVTTLGSYVPKGAHLALQPAGTASPCWSRRYSALHELRPGCAGDDAVPVIDPHQPIHTIFGADGLIDLLDREPAGMRAEPRLSPYRCERFRGDLRTLGRSTLASGGRSFRDVAGAWSAGTRIGEASGPMVGIELRLRLSSSDACGLGIEGGTCAEGMV